MGRLQDLLNGLRRPANDKAAEKRAIDRWENEGGLDATEGEETEPES